MAYLEFKQTNKRKKNNRLYKKGHPLIKEHKNGIVQTVELGDIILKSWDVVESIVPQERIGEDGKRRYYIPFMHEWTAQFNDKELMEIIKSGQPIKHYHYEAFLRISEKIKNGEFIPAKEG